MNRNCKKILLFLIVTLLTSFLLSNCQPIESNPEEILPTIDEILAMADEHFAGVELPETGNTRVITDSDYMGIYYPFSSNRDDGPYQVELDIWYSALNWVNFYNYLYQITDQYLINLTLSTWYQLEYTSNVGASFYSYHIIFLPYQTSSGNIYQMCVVRYAGRSPYGRWWEYFYYYLNF